MFSVSNNHCLTSLSVRSHNYILIPIVEVIVNYTYYTHALLDTGSSDSFCSKPMASVLSLSGPSTTYSLNTLDTTGEHTSQNGPFQCSIQKHSLTTLWL